ncbi:MAG TPA: transglycosylase domain-containing protein [Burkholderiaceae bacterium]
MQTPLPASLTELMRAENRKNGYSHITARILINKLAISWHGDGLPGWQTTYVTWTLLAHLHLAEQEQYSIIAANCYMGHGRFGYAAEAQERFGKPITSLNDTDLATLVVLTRSPSRYEEEPELLQISRDALLSKIRDSTSSQAR